VEAKETEYMIEILKGTKIDFMGKRYYAFALSGIFTLLSILAIVAIVRGTANLGIDFLGGTSVHLKFEKPLPLSEARKTLYESGIKDFDLQGFPYENKILIKVKRGEVGELKEKIITAFSTVKPENSFVIEGTTEIGPKISERLREDALKAIAIAFIGILIYITWRFQFGFAVGATIAVIHDVLAVLGLFYILGKEINLIVISAFLTIAGYSLTDTVVVFDRIRENLRLRLKEPVGVVINQSINEVLPRTIITSLTTLLACFALFFFGGEVIHDFSLAMILGIIVGNYSSIFVASPIVLAWKGKRPFKKT
jgi:preprotein translocase subunit SecF